MQKFGALLISIVAGFGVVATLLVSDALRTDARRGWEKEATNAAASLSGTLLTWLEESYAPISGLAALAENSERLTEAEFLNAFGSLEARATAFFLEAAALVEPVPGSDVEDWRIKFSTDTGGSLASGIRLAERPSIRDAVRVSMERFGEFVQSTPIDGGDNGRAVSPVALSTSTETGDVIIVGLVDYGALVRGLYQLRVPNGAAVSVTGRFRMPSGPGPVHQMIKQRIVTPLHSVPTRIVTASTELVITWDFDAGFLDGPPQDLARVALVSGLAGSAVITLLLTVLLRQNRFVMRRVDEATRELGKKEAQLSTALQNMPSGIIMIDEDLTIQAFNRRYVELYELPEGLLRIGGSLKDMIRLRAERGDYGAGDREQLIRDRLSGYDDGKLQVAENRVPGGRTLELVRNPRDGGGIVAVCTDITKRKQAEAVLIDQRRSAQLLHEISVAAHEVDNLDAAYQVCLDKVGDHMGWPIGHIYLVSEEDPDALVSSGVWHLSDENRFAAFRELTENPTWELSAGMHDGVLKSGEPAWIKDVTNNSKFFRAQVAKQCGVNTVFAFPVVSESGVIAVMEFFAEEIIEPDERTLAVLANVGNQLGSIVLRKRAEQAVAAKEAQLRIALNSMTDGIYVIDNDMNYVLFNEHYRQFVDLSSEAIRAGGPVERALREHAARGDYGDGEVDDLIGERLRVLADDQVVEREMSINNGERIVELRKAPMDGGGAVVVISDVTARRRAERELAHKEAQLSLALDTMTDGIWVIDPDMRFSLFNERYRELMGLPAEVLYAGAKVRDVVLHLARSGAWGDGDPEELVARRMAALADDQEVISETQTIDGRFLETRKAPRPDGSAVGLVTDITERKLAEQELATKEAQLRMAMDNMPGAMFVVDEDLKLVLMNDAYAECYGNPDGLIVPGGSIRDILKSEIKRGILSGEGTPEEVLEQRIQSYHPESTMTFEDRTPDGRYIQLTRTPAPGGHTVSVVVDITDLKLAEQAAEESREILQALADNIPEFLSMRDQDGKFIFVNNEFEKWAGAQRRDIIGKTVHDIYPEAHATWVEAQDRECRESQEVLTREMVRDFADGQTRTVINTRFPVISSSGKLLGSGNVNHDITERVRTEATARRLREAMEVFNDSIILYDEDEHVVFTNDRYHELYPNSPPKDEITGYTQEQLLRRSLETGQIDDPLAEADPESWLTIRLEERRRDKYKTGDTQHSNGRTHFYRHLPTTDGGLIVAHTDITERKQAEEDIRRAHELITDSIDYASNIQRSALPDDDIMRQTLGDHFVIWKPCDRVGGDIYWHRRWGEGDLIILADCTGHGVPGAFMTLIAGGALDRALAEVPAGDCAGLIQRMHQLVQQLLGQDRGEGYADDGLEIGVCYLPRAHGQLRFAGANISLYIQENGSVRELKGDRKEIGYRRLPSDAEFTNHAVETRSGMAIIMTTDGLPTQVGEQTRLPFGKRGFRQLLEQLDGIPMASRGDDILAALNDHMGTRAQRDDISLIGFEF